MFGKVQRGWSNPVTAFMTTHSLFEQAVCAGKAFSKGKIDLESLQLMDIEIISTLKGILQVNEPHRIKNSLFLRAAKIRLVKQVSFHVFIGKSLLCSK